jgi:hypothetical protein
LISIQNETVFDCGFIVVLPWFQMLRMPYSLGLVCKFSLAEPEGIVRYVCLLINSNLLLEETQWFQFFGGSEMNSDPSTLGLCFSV